MLLSGRLASIWVVPQKLNLQTFVPFGTKVFLFVFQGFVFIKASSVGLYPVCYKYFGKVGAKW